MGTTLVVNPGSSSKKYALYKNGEPVLEMHFEETNTGFEVCAQRSGTQQTCSAINEQDFSSAFTKMAEMVAAYLAEATVTLDTVVVRIVSPGTFFQTHRIIDDEFIRLLRTKESAVPLHIPAILREIQYIKQTFGAVTLVGASDSALHGQMPARAREFSIDTVDAAALDIYRFGYHGLSVASVIRRIHAHIGQDPVRMIVCHIGGGTSVTAVSKGVSVDTSMGFSPTSGIPTGSRASDLDPGALLECMRAKNFRAVEADMYINTRGGLLGSGGDSDIRRLLDKRIKGDVRATQALDMYVYHIQKAIAAQSVALGGIDVLALTGTAAVRSTELRAMIIERLTHLGINVNEERNDALVGKEGVISQRNSPVKVVVMRTDEMGEMAQAAESLMHKKAV